jgi:hypothetical protein
MATPRRKKATKRKGASRGRSSSSSPFTWFLTGLIVGFAISAALFFKGYLPEPPEQKPVPDIADSTLAEELVDDAESIAGESTDRRFDFFTVLPEMEVVVPEQDLSRYAQPENDSSKNDGDGSYILQVASFKNSGDAEQMKARLALLGNVATIQVVTINDVTWHRVRIGPISGARRTDELRRSLQDSDIETLVMKASP